MNRLVELQERVRQQNYDALLVTQKDNIRYISGFTGSAGTLLITATKAFLATDFRYIEQSKSQAPEFQIVQTKGNIVQWLLPFIDDMSLQIIGFEDDHLTFSEYRKLTDSPMTQQAGVKFVPAGGTIETMRMTKDKIEIDLIKRSAGFADDAIRYAGTLIKEGITEKEIAWQVEKYLREKGSEKLPFEIIVASGPNSAKPHATPGERVLKNGDPVVIDLGASYEGYCSDMTRTFCCGSGGDIYNKIYDITLAAQLAAIAGIEAGMAGNTADGIARSVITEAQYGDGFGHSLGHGIGLAVHELPRLGPNSSDILQENMVFSIEPGIYITGWGGIRIEDTVVLENGKIKLLTKADKTSPI